MLADAHRLERRRRREGPRGALALEQLHRDVQRAVGRLVEVVDVMVCGRRAAATSACPRAGSARPRSGPSPFGVQELERDLAAGRDLLPRYTAPKPPSPSLRLDLVAVVEEAARSGRPPPARAAAARRAAVAAGARRGLTAAGGRRDGADNGRAWGAWSDRTRRWRAWPAAHHGRAEPTWNIVLAPGADGGLRNHRAGLLRATATAEARPVLERRPTFDAHRCAHSSASLRAPRPGRRASRSCNPGGFGYHLLRGPPGVSVGRLRVAAGVDRHHPADRVEDRAARGAAAT